MSKDQKTKAVASARDKLMKFRLPEGTTGEDIKSRVWWAEQKAEQGLTTFDIAVAQICYGFPDRA